MRPFRECFRGLLATLRPLRWKVLVSCLLGLLQVAASLAFVWCSKSAVDIATGEAPGSLARGVGLFAGVLLLQILLRTAASYWEGLIVVNAQNDTRAQQSRTPVIKDKLPGRNDPCPCGSGKKFKNCHGRGLA